MRKPPRKNILSYFLPFVFLAAIIGGALYFFPSLSSFQFSSQAPSTLQVVQENVEVLLQGKDKWYKVPDTVQVKLFAGDAIRTDKKGEAKLHLLQDSFAYLGENSSVNLETLNESDAYQKTELEIIQGKIFFHIQRILNPKSEFIINFENTQLSSRGAKFILEEGRLQVLEGKVVAVLLNNKTELDRITVGIGQELLLSNEASVKFADLQILDANVYASEWLQAANGEKINEQLPMTNDQLEENKDVIASSDNDEVILSETKITEENTDKFIKVTGFDSSKAFTITEEPLELKGTVSEGAVKISVNDYALTQFKAGDTEWSYRAKQEWGNLAKGLNSYTIQAEFKDKTKLTTLVQINFEPKEEVVKTEAVSETSTPAETVKTTESPATETVNNNNSVLAVLSPKEDAKIEEETVTVLGSAPKGTAKITIGDYTLKTFTLGDTTWKYAANEKWDNLKVGEKNTYFITAYDANDKEISSISFSFFSTFVKPVAE